MNTFGKPESNSDVLNNHPKTLLIGYGWVGQYVHKYFTEADIVSPSKGYVNKDGEEIEGVIPHYDIAFISVPTPMKDDGSCDTSVVENCIAKWKDNVDLFIIRSTVTPGTTDYLMNEYKTRVVMQPEYVGETLGHPLVDIDRGSFIILGGKPCDTERAAQAWVRVLHANCRIRQVNALTAELCKYMENAFLGTKVVFVNEFRNLAEAMGVDYLTLREAWLDDPRIGRSHTLAYRDNPGFSGKCLPKDLNSIVHYAKNFAKSPLRLLEAVLAINASMRYKITNSVPLLPKNE